MRKQPFLTLPEGSQIFEVLSVEFMQKFTPIITILQEGKAECFRLPDELSEWAWYVVSMTNVGTDFFPCKVMFSNIKGRYYADIF